MTNKIKLCGLQFYAYHGCLAQERIVGGEYIIDLALTANLCKACLSDNLNETINYAHVYELISGIMQEPVNLLEHLAYKIASALFDKYDLIEAISIDITKLVPPIKGLQSKGITINLNIQRDEYPIKTNNP